MRLIAELDNKKFKVSKLTLPAKAQWEALIKHPIKDCDDNLITLEDCFDKSKPKPEQVEIDNPGMFNFWQSLSQESGLEIDYLQTHLFKRIRQTAIEIIKKQTIYFQSFRN
jgi:hypothetical protein